MKKNAETRFPIHPLIGERWSPRAFSERVPSDEELGSLLEAARWGASAFNEQPWRFFVGRRGDATYEGIVGSLVPFNASWAGKAPLLFLSVARLTFARNDKPNRHAHHDTGLASATLVLQAEALGMAAHMMAGFDPEVARRAFSIPEGFDPVAVMAAGFPGEPADLPEEMRDKELAPRERKPLGEIAFQKTWDEPLDL